MADHQIDQYRIIRHIGQGGMSSVYLAEDVNLKRQVVIKVLSTPLAANATFVARFQREARVIAQLDHPQIVQVYSVGLTPQGQPYIAMQYIEGGSLQDLVNQFASQGKLMPLSQVLQIVKGIAAALATAHEEGIVHRDIKPSNVLLRKDGSPVLVDLGIAALSNYEDTILTGTGALIGTPQYMAPELVMSQRVDARSDLYALGVVLYEMLTGKRPFEADSPIAVVHKTVYEDPVPVRQLRSDIPLKIDNIVVTLLQKDPKNRYQTAKEVIKAIDSALDLEEIELAKAYTLLPIEVVYTHAPQPSTVQEGLFSRAAAAIKSFLATVGSAILAIGYGLITLPGRVFARLPAAGSKRRAFPGGSRKAPPASGSSEQPTLISFPGLELSDLPADPASTTTTFGTMILDPKLGPILNPFAEDIIREFLSPQEPDRIAQNIVYQGRRRFLLTGYGSFGGTKLAGEIVSRIQNILNTQINETEQNLLVFHFQFADQDDLSESDCQVVTWASGSPTKKGLGKFVWGEHARGGIPPLQELLYAVSYLTSQEKINNSIYKNLLQATEGKRFAKIIFIVDKVYHQEILHFFMSQPLFEQNHLISLFIVEREQYNRWPNQLRSRLQKQRKFQAWYVPCLWEPEHRVIHKMMRSMFSNTRDDTAAARELRHTFEKYIGFKSRGQIGAIFYELQQGQYWHVDMTTGQPYILIDDLDTDLLNHHARLQDLLEANWLHILGSGFVGRKAVDRARQGVYSLLDWITDASTFTLEEVFSEAAQRPILITPHQRLRTDVVLRLLDVLVDNDYLKRVDNAYDVIWGRDPSDEIIKTKERVERGDITIILEKQLSELHADYEAASKQLGQALSAVDRARIERQVEDLRQQIENLENKLNI